MPVRRTLALKREVLQDLSHSDLTDVVGASVRPTAASCLPYISCWWFQCVLQTALCTE